MKNILAKLHNLPTKWAIFQKSGYFLPVILGLFSVLLALQTHESKKEIPAPSPQYPESPDTFIPRDHVLVPIDVQNIESLDSMIGQFGVVDLYGESDRKPIESGVRIIRSPKDPSQFAILIHERDAPRLVERAFAPLRVVLQNSRTPKSPGGKTQRRRNIIFEGSKLYKSNQTPSPKELV